MADLQTRPLPSKRRLCLVLPCHLSAQAAFLQLSRRAAREVRHMPSMLVSCFLCKHTLRHTSFVSRRHQVQCCTALSGRSICSTFSHGIFSNSW